MTADIVKVGLLVISDGRLLLCRKNRDTALLILPGGKIDPGEGPIECLDRELREELGDVRAIGAEYVGTYRDRAAGAESRIVEIQLYHAALEGEPRPQAEIAELIWFGENDDRARLSHVLANRILPDLIARGILTWGRR